MMGMVVIIIVRIGIATIAVGKSSVTFYFGSIVSSFHFSIYPGTMVRVGMVVCLRERRRISDGISIVITMMRMMRRHKRRMRMRLVRILMVRIRVIASILMMVIVQ
jgi:hypothetical protein